MKHNIRQEDELRTRFLLEQIPSQKHLYVRKPKSNICSEMYLVGFGAISLSFIINGVFSQNKTRKLGMCFITKKVC